MLDRGPTFPILQIPSHATEVEQETEWATSAGEGHERNADAVSIFTLEVPTGDWSGVVLAVANSQGWSARGDVASAVAVDALEAELIRSSEHLDFTSNAWQEPLAEVLTSAFEHANARVRTQLDDANAEPRQGVALAAAVLFGNWLAVAHAGDCRAYRLSGNALEQITADDGYPILGPSEAADRPVRTLGLAEHLTPAIRFVRVKRGDVVLVCSNGLCRHLDGEDLAALLGAEGSASEIAKSLVTAAAERGGDDDMSACLARVGRLRARRLPDPPGTAVTGRAAQDVELPRYQTRVVTRSGSRRLGLMLGAIALAGGTLGGSWLLPATLQVAAPVALLDTALAQPKGNLVRVTPVATLVTPDPPAPAPTKREAAARHPALVTSHSPETNLRRVKDSVAAPEPKVAEERIRDSLAAAQAIELGERKAREQREARARAEHEELELRTAQARAEQEAAAKALAAEQMRDEILAAGRTALTGWMNSVVSYVNAGNLSASVLAAGPSEFAAFVRRNRPKLSDPRLLTVTVNEETGEATAEWVAKWRTDFGTTTSRSMKATATMAPDGSTWRLRSWRITEGLP